VTVSQLGPHGEPFGKLTGVYPEKRHTAAIQFVHNLIDRGIELMCQDHYGPRGVQGSVLPMIRIRVTAAVAVRVGLRARRAVRVLRQGHHLPTVADKPDLPHIVISQRSRVESDTCPRLDRERQTERTDL
jgi:hypothetical protein